MHLALKHFSDEEFAVLQVCSRMGWTLGEWEHLPEQEQIDWLAFEYRRKQLLDTVLGALKDRIAANDAVDQSAYVLMLIERFAR